MSFKKRFLASSLAAVLTLGMATGCTTVKKSDISDDYSQVVAATYGDEEIYLDEVNYYLRNRQLMYEFYSSMYGTNLLETEDSQDTLREEVMSVIYQTRVLCDHAADYNVELTDADKEVVKKAVDELLTTEDNEAFLEIAGSDEGMLTELMTKNALANKVYDAIVSEKEITTTKDSVRTNSVSYLLFPEKPAESEDGTEAETSEESSAADETKEETAYYTEEDADAALKKIQSGTSIEDVGKELGIEVSENNFTINKEQTSEYGKVAVTLKDGESASAYMENVGWYVMYCNTANDEEATAQAYDEAVNTEKSEYFSEVYKELDKAKFKVNEDVIKFLDIAGTPVYNIGEEEETEGTSEGETAESTEGASTGETEAGTQAETEAETQAKTDAGIEAGTTAEQTNAE